MSKYIIEGGNKLLGEVKIHGAKNSILPILAASCLNSKESIILDAPALSDVYESIEILKFLGCSATQTGDVIRVDSSTLSTDEVPERLMLKMRSSVIFLGALIARCKSGKVTLPGGCEIGPRPIDLHLKAFREMGILIKEEGGIITCDAKNMKSAKIHLDFPSVGATENIMLAAVGAKGTTIITNAAKEPEIVDLQNYLRKIGVNVRGAGTDRIYIDGTTEFRSATHRVIPDRIEAATYMVAALMTEGDILIKNVDASHMEAFLSVLSDAGAGLDIEKNNIRVYYNKRLRPVKRIRTYPYPGFPTDMQAPVMALFSKADGTTIITETIFHDRFHHVDGLTRMGADIVTDGNVAIIKGVKELKGAKVKALDLRGGAALTVASLSAKGISEVENLSYIERGYEDFEGNLRNLGAKIKKE